MKIFTTKSGKELIRKIYVPKGYRETIISYLHVSGQKVDSIITTIKDY